MFNDEFVVLLEIEVCVKEIYVWMVCNGFRINCDKIEFLVIYVKYCLWLLICDIKIVGVRVVLIELVRNIGVMFNDVMNYEY